MFINNLMLPRKKLITVEPKMTVGEALELMEKNKFLSIPVALDEKFYGSISKESIYTYYYEKSIERHCLLSDFLVEDVMRKDIPTLAPLDQVEKAAHYLETKSVSFIAVIDDREKFLGIITHNAIFHAFTELFGLNQGSRLAVIAYDIPGQISKLSSIISENGGEIISFVVVDPKSLTEVKEIIMRITTDNMEKMVDKIKSAGFKVQ